MLLRDYVEKQIVIYGSCMYGRLAELIIVLVLFLLFFGPGKLPRVMQELGRGIRMLKKGLSADVEELDDNGSCDGRKMITDAARSGTMHNGTEKIEKASNTRKLKDKGAVIGTHDGKLKKKRTSPNMYQKPQQESVSTRKKVRKQKSTA